MKYIGRTIEELYLRIDAVCKELGVDLIVDKAWVIDRDLLDATSWEFKSIRGYDEPRKE